MLYYKFKNYDEFKNIFGTQKDENGTSGRRNKILLAHLKDKELLHRVAIGEINKILIRVTNLVDLKNILITEIAEEGSLQHYHKLNLNGATFWSSKYSTDDFKGLCEDGDLSAIRYYNHETEQTFKMKAGKLFRTIILDTELGRLLTESVINHLCQEFASEWQTFTTGLLPQNELFVDENFSDIYDPSICKGNFNSCMAGKDYHYFYENSVNANAAYLMNRENEIIARCIIFNDVTDQDGKKWRLAERQYSTNGNEIYKRILIDKLIKGKHIDGYKTIGSDCGAATSFVDIHDNSLSHLRFRIDCDLELGATLSYQDSFKWYDYDNKMAANYEVGDYRLDKTEGQIYDEYDSWHDCHCFETTTVFYHGNEYYCDVNCLDDFIWIESLDEYHHRDDVETCDICNTKFLKKDGHYSEITEEHYDCKSCLDDAESTYKEDNWYHSWYDDEYFEDEEDITEFWCWSDSRGEYEQKTISIESLDILLASGSMFIYEDEYYDELDEEANMPYHLLEEAIH